MSFGGLLDGLELGDGAVSTGFCVSVGWPVTSPGFDEGDMPGSLRVVPVEGDAGRETLPLVSELPLLLEPVSLVPDALPEEAPEFGLAGVVGLVFVSFDDGVSEGELRCIELVSLELLPWLLFLWCFLCFLWVVVVVVVSSVLEDLSEGLADDELSLPMPVDVEAEPVEGVALDDVSWVELDLSSGSRVFELPLSELGVEFADGLLLGSELLLFAVFDELPGSALLFWSAGSVAEPLSSVVPLFGFTEPLRVSLVPVPVLVVLVCARAPNAISAAASAVPMIFIEPPWLCTGRSGDSNPKIQPTGARPTKPRKGNRPVGRSLFGADRGHDGRRRRLRVP